MDHVQYKSDRKMCDMIDSSDAIWYFSIPDFTNLVLLEWFGIYNLADLFTVWYFFMKISIYCLVFKIVKFTK